MIFRKFLFISLLFSLPAQSALHFGPFILKGFITQDVGVATPICHRCAEFPDEDRQREWADRVPADQSYGPRQVTLSLIQPYLGTKKFHLGKGFKISGLLSQRWRDGKIDIPGVVYERNLTLEHEYYGILQAGGFPTRAWGIADFPYGAHLGLADPWGASGSGYGIMTQAIRYAFPLFDIFEGDLRLEYTRDFGAEGYTRLKPEFHEVWLQYVRNGVLVDFFYQLGINGLPGSWTHGPFRGITNESRHEQAATEAGLSQNRQELMMLLTHFPVGNSAYVYAGIRRNYWSGANAVIVDAGSTNSGDELWNNMFNVDWNSADARGYSATSIDAMTGARHRFGRWTSNYGLVYLGEAQTKNPMERGQSNSAIFGAAGLGYSPISIPKLSFGPSVGFARFKKKGLAPLSMPAHTAFGGYDSRVETWGYSLGLNIEYNL